jgi:hypothetical protein
MSDHGLDHDSYPHDRVTDDHRWTDDHGRTHYYGDGCDDDHGHDVVLILVLDATTDGRLVLDRWSERRLPRGR